MASHNCEMFGHITYSAELSYNELYAIEADLIDEFSEKLAEAGAQHVDLAGQGDALRVQCVFDSYDEEIFHAVCDALAPVIPQNVHTRLLFVDKSLNAIHMYSHEKGEWKEGAVDISSGACLCR